jgi:hypothetical protein
MRHRLACVIVNKLGESYAEAADELTVVKRHVTAAMFT